MGGGLVKPQVSGSLYILDDPHKNRKAESVDEAEDHQQHSIGTGHFVRPYSLGVPYLVRYPFIDFKLVKILGKGRFSTVHLAASLKEITMKVAIREIRVSDMNRYQIADMKYELNVLSNLKHKHLARIASVFDPHSHKGTLYVVMEHLRGGELLPAICRQRQYMESDAVRFIQQLASAVNYLHNHGVVHGNIVPENLILTDHSFESNLRLVEFGYAQCETQYHNYYQPNYQYLNDFRLPEIQFERRLTYAMDIWCVGVIAHIILSGLIPFENSSQYLLHPKYSFEDPRWNPVSDVAKDFLCKLLSLDPRDRPKSEDVVKHPWINLDDISGSSPSPSFDNGGGSPSGKYGASLSPPPSGLSFNSKLNGTAGLAISALTGGRRGSAALEKVTEEDENDEEEERRKSLNAGDRQAPRLNTVNDRFGQSSGTMGMQTSNAVVPNMQTIGGSHYKSRATSMDSTEDLDDDVVFTHYDLTPNLPYIRYFQECRQTLQPALVSSNTINFVRTGRYIREKNLAMLVSRENFGEFLQTTYDNELE